MSEPKAFRIAFVGPARAQGRGPPGDAAAGLRPGRRRRPRRSRLERHGLRSRPSRSTAPCATTTMTRSAKNSSRSRCAIRFAALTPVALAGPRPAGRNRRPRSTPMRGHDEDGEDYRRDRRALRARVGSRRARSIEPPTPAGRGRRSAPMLPAPHRLLFRRPAPLGRARALRRAARAKRRSLCASIRIAT